MEIMWSLIVFTLCVCISAGTFAVQGLYAVLGRGTKAQLPALLVAFCALVVGGIGSFTHLQHWERAFNGFGHLTSGITQELIGAALMVVAMAVYFVVSRRQETVPKWAGIMAIVVSVLMIVLMSGSYMMPARPIWHTPVLYLFYFAEAIVSGGAVAWVVSAASKADDIQALSARITALGGLLVVVAAVAYLAVIGSAHFTAVGYYYDTNNPTKSMVDSTAFLDSVITGSLAAYFWGTVLLGGLLAAVLGFIKRKDGASGLFMGAIACIGAIVGGVLFRVMLYVLGSSAFLFF
ncbi:MAG: hypothetical protein LBG81_08680 [Coriobacteriaceae bacterium]|jgi:anaerobic dimethyl sulfoxide reductase subunit C (anchor subunit)|nr:hypothetical protein [Coriobacteriaceae bacterium]